MATRNKTIKPAKPRKQKRKAGQPMKAINLAAVERAAGIGCSRDEIAAVLGVARSTLYTRMASEPEIEAAIERGADKGRARLRRLQWKGAVAGNATMLTWLGKQLLGQRDSLGLQQLDKAGNPTDAPLRVIIELVGGAGAP